MIHSLTYQIPWHPIFWIVALGLIGIFNGAMFFKKRGKIHYLVFVLLGLAFFLTIVCTYSLLKLKAVNQKIAQNDIHLVTGKVKNFTINSH